MTASLATRWGIIAGRGDYPVILARRIVDSGQEVVVVRIAGQADATGRFAPIPVIEAPLGAMREAAWKLRAFGVERAFFAGGIGLSLRTVLSSRPDRSVFSALRAAWRACPRLGDDRLLRCMADEMGRLGVSIEDPAPFIRDLLAGEGLLAGPAPDDEIRGDLSLAARAARRVGTKDRGQCALVHRGHLVASEGRGGTDALMRRSPGEGAVLAKVVKPGQDLRFDRPTIGPRTIATAAVSGVRLIGVEAAGVMILNPSRVFELCRDHGISLVGL